MTMRQRGRHLRMNRLRRTVHEIIREAEQKAPMERGESEAVVRVRSSAEVKGFQRPREKSERAGVYVSLLCPASSLWTQNRRTDLEPGGSRGDLKVDRGLQAPAYGLSSCVESLSCASVSPSVR